MRPARECIGDSAGRRQTPEKCRKAKRLGELLRKRAMEPTHIRWQRGILAPRGEMWGIYRVGCFISPYFFIFLYKVTRLIPRASAARVRLKPWLIRARWITFLSITSR